MLMTNLITAMRSIAAARIKPASPFAGMNSAQIAGLFRAHWLGQHTNPEKNKLRKAKRAIGARQARVQAKEARRVLRLAAEWNARNGNDVFDA